MQPPLLVSSLSGMSGHRLQQRCGLAFRSTQRLLLRQWRPCDFPSFAQMNGDEEVMRFFPAKLSEQESKAMAQRCCDPIPLLPEDHPMREHCL